MFCPYCALQLQAITPYCPRCGYALRANIPQGPPMGLVPPAQGAVPAMVTPPPQPESVSSSGSSRNNARRRHLVRIVGTAILLIAVTVAGCAFRSNIIYQNSLLRPSSLWPQTDTCTFGADGYHLLGTTPCPSQLFQLSDFNLSVDVKDLSDGSQSHGLLRGFGLVLGSSSINNSYRYIIDSAQRWFLFKGLQNVDAGISDAIYPGLNATNTLEIQASAGRFDLYVNGTQVKQINDPALSSVILALFNEGDGSEVVFTNIKVTHV